MIKTLRYFCGLLLVCLNCAAIAQDPFSCAVTVDGAVWCAIRDFGVRQEGINQGTGSFLSFQSKNQAGVWGDWTFLNGGLVDRATGKEQGNLDLIVFVNGQPNGVSIQGNLLDYSPALFPVTSGEMDIGRPYARFQNIYFSGSLNTSLARQCPDAINSLYHKMLLGCLSVTLGSDQGYVPVLRATLVEPPLAK